MPDDIVVDMVGPEEAVLDVVGGAETVLVVVGTAIRRCSSSQAFSHLILVNSELLTDHGDDHGVVHVWLLMTLGTL